MKPTLNVYDASQTRDLSKLAPAKGGAMSADIDKERAAFEGFMQAEAPTDYDASIRDAQYIWSAAWQAARVTLQAEHHIEVLTVERDQARARYDHVFEVMMSVFNLAPNGKDIHLPDGRVMWFKDPNAAETLHALGRAIWAIPEKLAAAPLPRQAAVQGDPVKYELRMRAPNGNCAPWSETDAGMYARYTENPDIGDGFTYETRALIVAPTVKAGQ